jgi:hypothetical protein
LRQITQNDYPNDEFLHIDWHTSGLLANGSGASRANYYGVGGVPDVFFDGYDHVVGAGDSTVARNQYLTRITNHLNDPTYSEFLVSAEVNLNGDTFTGAITVDVEVAPGHTITSPTDVRIRAALYEDDIIMCCEPRTGNNEWNYVGRMMIFDEVLTISNSGEQQHIAQNFALNPSWDVANLHAVAFVQRNSTKRISQAAKALNLYGLNVVNLDPLVASTPGTPADFDTEITYAGSTANDVTVTLDKSALPAGWDGEIQWGAVTDPSSITIPGMSQGQMEAVTIRMLPDASPGFGTLTVTTAPVSNPGVGVVIDYNLFSNLTAVLYVDDDRGENWGTHFEDALAGAGYAFITREVQSAGDPSAAELATYDAVVWGTGRALNFTIEPATQEELKTYLNAGGKCFIASQGLLNHIGINDFTENYLGVAAATLFARAPSAVGVPADPIGDGLAFDLTPPYSDFAPTMTPGLGTIWLVGENGDIGIRHESGSFRTAFMSAGFEGLPPGDAAVVMERVLDWLLDSNPTDVQTIAGARDLSLALWQNAPNPFGGSTRVRFAVPREGPVRLTVYDVTGRRVANLVDRVLDGGEHSTVWNGLDGSGQRAASGVYLYLLQAAGETLTKGMVLTR